MTSEIYRMRIFFVRSREWKILQFSILVKVYPYMMKKHLFTVVLVLLSVGFMGRTVAANARESIPMDFKVNGFLFA